MTLADHHVSSFSPWLSIWFRPGDTVARALSSTRTWQILVLAGLGAVAGLIYQVMRDPLFRLGLLDWRVLSGVILAGFILGILLLYLYGLLFRLAGAWLGGRASQAQVRTALAWGMAPSATAGALCATILAGLPASVGRDASRLFSGPVGTALTAILSIAALWTLIVTILTLKRVQGFGFWRAVASYAIGSLLILFVTLLPLMFRSLLFQPFSAQSGSMAPTLLVGDYFFVAKYPAADQQPGRQSGRQWRGGDRHYGDQRNPPLCWCRSRRAVAGGHPVLFGLRRRHRGRHQGPRGRQRRDRVPHRTRRHHGPQGQGIDHQSVSDEISSRRTNGRTSHIRPPRPGRKGRRPRAAARKPRSVQGAPTHRRCSPFRPSR